MQSTTKSKITTAIIVAVLLVIAFMLGGIAPRSHQRAKYRTTVQLLGYYDSVEHYADGEPHTVHNLIYEITEDTPKNTQSSYFVAMICDSMTARTLETAVPAELYYNGRGAGYFASYTLNGIIIDAPQFLTRDECKAQLTGDNVQRVYSISNQT